MLVSKGFYIYIWIVSISEQKPGRTSRVKKQLDYLLFRSIIQGIWVTDDVYNVLCNKNVPPRGKGNNYKVIVRPIMLYGA